VYVSLAEKRIKNHPELKRKAELRSGEQDGLWNVR